MDEGRFSKRERSSRSRVRSGKVSCITIMCWGKAGFRIYFQAARHAQSTAFCALLAQLKSQLPATSGIVQTQTYGRFSTYLRRYLFE